MRPLDVINTPPWPYTDTFELYRLRVRMQAGGPLRLGVCSDEASVLNAKCA